MNDWNIFHDKVLYSWFPEHRKMVLVSKNKRVFCAQLLSGINGYWWEDENGNFITNFEGTKGWMPYPDPDVNDSDKLLMNAFQLVKNGIKISHLKFNEFKDLMRKDHDHNGKIIQ